MDRHASIQCCERICCSLLVSLLFVFSMQAADMRPVAVCPGRTSDCGWCTHQAVDKQLRAFCGVCVAWQTALILLHWLIHFLRALQAQCAGAQSSLFAKLVHGFLPFLCLFRC